ncbi:MAG: DUF3793 family protein [Clostridia bacterium]
MPFETIIRHCAPTLAGMKVGSLFSYRFSCKKEILDDIKKRNELLNSRGIYFKILKMYDNFALIYVFRRKKLEEILENAEIRDFLSQNGYYAFDLEKALEILEENLKANDFPHEIGVFLDYPLSDIKAFIEFKGANPKYVGCWKAYSNEDCARKITEKFKKCTNVYCKKFAEGTDIIRLTVAC